MTLTGLRFEIIDNVRTLGKKVNLGGRLAEDNFRWNVKKDVTLKRAELTYKFMNNDDVVTFVNILYLILAWTFCCHILRFYCTKIISFRN